MASELAHLDPMLEWFDPEGPFRKRFVDLVRDVCRRCPRGPERNAALGAIIEAAETAEILTILAETKVNG